LLLLGRRIATRRIASLPALGSRRFVARLGPRIAA